MTEIGHPKFVQITAGGEHHVRVYALDENGGVWWFTGTHWEPLPDERKPVSV